MRRTKEEAQETRRVILAASRTLFLQKGYSATTLEDIAVAAGFTRGAVHWHFQNKAGVLRALQNEESSPMQHLLDRLTDNEMLDPFEALSSTISVFFSELTEQPEKRQLLRVIFQETFAGELLEDLSEGKHFENALITTIRAILKHAERRGMLAAPWTSQNAALALQSLVKGLMSSWLYQTVSFDLARDGSETVRLFLNALRRP